MKNMIKKLYENKKLKGKEGMIILILVGVLFAVITIPTEKKEDGSEKEMVQEVSELSNYDDYEAQLEKRLEEILSCVDGVGRVKVMITLQASSKEIIEKDISTQQEHNTNADNDITSHSTKEENAVYTENGNTSMPYVVQEIYPEIEGILVVAEGGDNSYINLAITDAIQALFDVEIHKIKIVKMNTN